MLTCMTGVGLERASRRVSTRHARVRALEFVHFSRRRRDFSEFPATMLGWRLN